MAGNIAPALEPFQKRIPPFSFYYKEQSTANSNSFKIVQKAAFEAKERLYTTGKVIRRLFIIDLHTQLAIYVAISEANGNSSTFTINNYRLHRQIVWAPCAVSILASHADVLRLLSRVPPHEREKRVTSLRTSA